jgi:hypothetical protein
MTPTREGQGADWDLEVLLSGGCASCEHSLTVLGQLAVTHPHVRVRVTDIDEPGWVAPPGFVGTPMFLTGGRVVSLGNPTVQALRAMFGQEDHGPAHR